MSDRKFKVGDNIVLNQTIKGNAQLHRGKAGIVAVLRDTLGDYNVVIFDGIMDHLIKDEEMDLAYPSPQADNLETVIQSDGGSSTYYDLPTGARDLDDLIVHKNMPWPIANIFKACYRFGEKAGTDKSYDVNKILFFAGRMKERLESKV